MTLPAPHSFGVVSALLYALTTLGRKKSLIYTQAHSVQFFFTQRLPVLGSSHVYANATHLAYSSFSDPWCPHVPSLQFDRASFFLFTLGFEIKHKRLKNYQQCKRKTQKG